MPPVLGPWSPSKARLWSCAVASGSAVSPSTSAKKLASSPSRNSSMTTSAPAAPNAPPKQSSIAALACLARLGDDYAFAGREPVGLDDDGQALRGHISLGRGRVVEAAIGGRGDAVFGAEILGEAFGAFELCRRPRRPEHFDACRLRDRRRARRRAAPRGRSPPGRCRSPCRSRSPPHGPPHRAPRSRRPPRSRHCPARNRAGRAGGFA